MKIVNICITNNGEENAIYFVTNPEVLKHMYKLEAEGDDEFKTLQVTELGFTDDADIDHWVEVNYIVLSTPEDFE